MLFQWSWDERMIIITTKSNRINNKNIFIQKVRFEGENKNGIYFDTTCAEKPSWSDVNYRLPAKGKNRKITCKRITITIMIMIRNGRVP
jgi:hypothetical protein